jgi:Putative zinc ribbon domain
MGAPHRRRAVATICQSCGMPLERDSAKRAGIHSPDDAPYCTHCYRAGRFVLPDLTVQQMQARVLAKLRKVGVPEPRARLLTRRIGSLRRWKVDE